MTQKGNKGKELVQYLMAGCKSTGDIQEKMKRLFAGTIEQALEAEMDEHLGFPILIRSLIDSNLSLGNLNTLLFCKSIANILSSWLFLSFYAISDDKKN